MPVLIWLVPKVMDMKSVLCHYLIIHLNPYYGEIYQNISIKFLAKYIVCNLIAYAHIHKCRISCAFEGVGGLIISQASTLAYCLLYYEKKKILTINNNNPPHVPITTWCAHSPLNHNIPWLSSHTRSYKDWQSQFAANAWCKSW